MRARAGRAGGAGCPGVRNTSGNRRPSDAPDTGGARSGWNRAGRRSAPRHRCPRRSGRSTGRPVAGRWRLRDGRPGNPVKQGRRDAARTTSARPASLCHAAAPSSPSLPLRPLRPRPGCARREPPGPDLPRSTRSDGRSGGSAAPATALPAVARLWTRSGRTGPVRWRRPRRSRFRRLSRRSPRLRGLAGTRVTIQIGLDDFLSFLFSRHRSSPMFASPKRAEVGPTSKPGVLLMIERRKFSELGGADHGWLKAKHHFSFARYYDPARMHWGNLRVWNDDEIAAGAGFPPHPHADMEIITYVRDGAITHQDSMGNTGRTEAGDVQVMSAGSGVRHSEFNLEDDTTRLFQIWIEPTESGGNPSWGAKQFPKGDRSGRFVTLASGFAEDEDALKIRADARV